MSLLPFTGIPHTGDATFYNSTEIALPNVALAPFNDLTWGDGGGNVYVLAQSNRIYIYSTPVAYRVQSLTGGTSFFTMTPSGTGSGSLDRGMTILAGNFYIMRFDGQIEKFSFTGTFEQKLDTGLGSQARTPRLNAIGSRVFYQNDNVIYWRDLSTNRDLTTAGSASSQTFTGFTVSESFDFNDDGSKLYIADSTNDRIREYPLSTDYDPSTAGSVTLHTYSPTGDLSGITIDNVGDALVIGENGIAGEMVKVVL